MQAVQAGGAAVPVYDSASSSNPPAAVPKHYRYSSRSNSFSSASVVTVKRTASLSSTSTGARNSALPMRAQSPGETSLITLRVGREQLSQSHKRRKSVAIDATERPDSGILGNLHKHSGSAASSVASTSNTRRSRASSGALFAGITNQNFSPKKRSAGTIDYSPRASLHAQQRSRPSSKRLSPASSPERERRRPSRPELNNPLNSLPSLHATPALTEPNDVESPSTIQTIATPSTQTSYGPDYFVDDGASPSRHAQTDQSTMILHHSGPFSSTDPAALQAREGVFDADGVRHKPDPQAVDATRSVPRERRDHVGSSRPTLASANNPGPHKSSRPRERGEKEKKSMIARALEKANTAVHLDNEQNFAIAMIAYIDACDLLQQVMDLSSGPDDRSKLEAIKSTYTARIDQLREMELLQPLDPDEKELPERPMSEDSFAVGSLPTSPSLDSGSRAPQNPSHANSAQSTNFADLEEDFNDMDYEAAGAIIYDTQGDPLLTQDLDLSQASTGAETTSLNQPPPPTSSAPSDAPSIADSEVYSSENKAILSPQLRTSNLHLPPHDDRYIPAPLSPKRSSSPQRKDDSQLDQRAPMQISSLGDMETETYLDPNTAASWLDTIEEDGSSRTSSVHSVSSEQGLHRKYLRGLSDASNPDLDAAFDAAVEAAYDQGLEPDLEGARPREEPHTNHTPNVSLNVRSSEIAEIPSLDSSRRLYGDPILGADDEEERILDDIARDYARTFNFDVSSKSALPRQSDSSGYSRSTWQSSQTSDRTTAGTSLSTVAEDGSSAFGSKNAFAATSSINSLLAEGPPLHSPPSAPPQTSLPRPPSMSQNRQSGVRSRRLSGQAIKNLKIETPGKADVRQRASTFHNSSSPFKEDDEERSELDHDFKFGTSTEPLTASDIAHSDILKSPPPLDLRSVVSDGSRPATATTSDPRQSLEEGLSEMVPHRPTLMKRNKSSVEHMVLRASPTADHGPSLMTPLSSTFMSFVSKRHETPLTSQRANLPSFGSTVAEGSGPGVLLFDTSLTAPDSASSPKSPPIPAGVEPCPESFLLRPFWLMRNIAGTLTHPKGGFLTSQLFVPREVWQTKGVKLKSIEDKIANCDLLSAALGRLAGVDTFDADAVVEELQIFEDVMERVQTTLVKKLGSEVGVAGSSGIFKEAASSNHSFGSSASLASDAANIKSKEGKGYLSSWRKLRSKSSGAPIVTGHAASKGSSGRGAEQDGFNMPSVPMTSWISVERRGHNKDVRNMVFEGEHRHYMSSLASLFEGVQVLDQIARQVEDPGLRAVSSTHVGMELSIRHAAEFFGFYICRFVLADLGLLIDKFVKRGSEWVLA